MVQKFQTGKACATENYVQRSDKIDPFSKMSMSIKQPVEKYDHLSSNKLGWFYTS